MHHCMSIFLKEKRLRMTHQFSQKLLKLLEGKDESWESGTSNFRRNMRLLYLRKHNRLKMRKTAITSKSLIKVFFFLILSSFMKILKNPIYFSHCGKQCWFIKLHFFQILAHCGIAKYLIWFFSQ